MPIYAELNVFSIFHDYVLSLGSHFEATYERCSSGKWIWAWLYRIRAAFAFVSGEISLGDFSTRDDHEPPNTIAENVATQPVLPHVLYYLKFVHAPNCIS